MAFDYFSLPTGYSCVQRANDTTLYGYTGSRRDTFILNGWKWEKVSQTTSTTTIPTGTVCVSGSQIPASVIPAWYICGSAFAICFFIMIKCIFKPLLRRR